MLQSLSAFLLPALLIIAAVSDITSFRIPNWLTLLTAALFFPMAWATGMPWHDFVMHLLAGVILFIVGFAFFTFRVFGGGDAKLMAAAGLWFGTAKVVPFLTLTALSGGVVAVGVAIWAAFMLHWQITYDKGSMGSIGARLRKMNLDLPYGLAFALGGILAFKDTWWMTGLS